MNTKNERTITSQATQPSNYTQMPNMAIQDLSACAYKLLAVLMNTSWSKGVVWKKNKVLADEVGCSVNTMKKAEQELAEKGYIHYTPGTTTERAIVEILYNDIWARNERGLSNSDNTLSNFDTLTKEDSSKKTLKDSSAEKSAEDITPDPLISDTKKKGEDSTSAPEIDWQAKILATLTDDWMAASDFEALLGITDGTFNPFGFSKNPAAIALYAFEGQRKVEYLAVTGKRRQWRLHPDGQPAPKSDFDLLKAAIVRRLDINNGALLSMTHMLSGSSAKKDTAYYKESQFFEDEPCTPDDIDAMVDYFHLIHPELPLPRKPMTISDWVTRARKHKAAAGKEPEMNWDVGPEEPPPLMIIDWEEDES